MELQYKKCKQCGNEFTTFNKQKFFCSIKCKGQWTYGHRSYTVVCPCGKTFTTRCPDRKFCSDECNRKYKKATASFDLICQACHKPFTSCKPFAIYCSNECRHRGCYKYVPKCKDGIYRKVCKRCGKEFDTGSHSKCFCDDCIVIKTREQAKNYAKTHPEKVRLNQQKRIKINSELCAKRRLANAVKVQEELNASAEQLPPITKKLEFDFMQLGLVRLTRNKVHCIMCGNDFYMCKNGDDGYRRLKSYLDTKSSPCPYCGQSGKPVYGGATNVIGSRSENEIAALYPNFTVRHYRPDFMGGKEIDLYDPENRLGIELHGLAWHSTKFSNDCSEHFNKASMAEEGGVQLLQIYESEWVQRRECVIDKIDAILHKGMKKIPARKLQVKEMRTERERRLLCGFMEKNHIQGAAGSNWAVALMNGKEIAAACTFRLGTGYASGGQTPGTDCYWELNRFATRLHTCVQGGLSRCIAAFKNAHPGVREIFSFADRRWTCPQRSAYGASGFKAVGIVPQNYMYSDLSTTHPLRNKQYMRKSSIARRARVPGSPESEVFDARKTEKQMAEELGYYQVFDAGKIKYRMELS